MKNNVCSTTPFNSLRKAFDVISACSDSGEGILKTEIKTMAGNFLFIETNAFSGMHYHDL